MKQYRWQMLLGITLVLLSAVFYFFHYAIFRDAHHIFIYLIGDIAFVFIEVLLVTLIIHRVLDAREKREKLEKLNVVIGTFFSEFGTDALTYLSDFDLDLEEKKKQLIVSNSWSKQDFQEIKKDLKKHIPKISIQGDDLKELFSYFLKNRSLMLRLLENPTLMEHASFTELLRAIVHFIDELKYRKNLEALPASDLKHLEGDVKRVYGFLVLQWLDHMRYLKAHYPYLFSLAMRTNPFDEDASAIII